MIFGSPVDARWFLVLSGAAGARVGGHDIDVQHHHPRPDNGALFDYRKWRTIGLPASE